MNRRHFLSAILAAGVAPAVVRVANLMPVRVLESGVVLPHVYRDLARHEFAEYQAAVLHSIAASLSIPYEFVIADYEKAEYSAALLCA